MSSFNKDYAATLIEQGLDPGLAIPAAMIGSRDVALVVVSSGGLSGIPDPGCVAQRLSGIQQPTRADILSAIEACST